MKIGFSCALSDKAEDSLGRSACDATLARLGAAYPAAEFAPSDDTGAPRVEVRVAQASDRGLGLQLIWTAPDGQRHEGAVIAVSAMDRPLSASLREGVIRRVVDETPLPF